MPLTLSVRSRLTSASFDCTHIDAAASDVGVAPPTLYSARPMIAPMFVRCSIDDCAGVTTCLHRSTSVTRWSAARPEPAACDATDLVSPLETHASHVTACLRLVDFCGEKEHSTTEASRLRCHQPTVLDR